MITRPLLLPSQAKLSQLFAVLVVIIIAVPQIQAITLEDIKSSGSQGLGHGLTREGLKADLATVETSPTVIASAQHTKLCPDGSYVSRTAPNSEFKACPQASPAPTYDVVIAGAGTSGVAAAIQAKRMGGKVALLEETDWVGGQMTAAGVTSIDEAGTIPENGIYKEFMNRVRANYGSKSIATCFWSDRRKCFEPHIGQQILLQMIAEQSGAGKIDLLLRKRVVSVQKNGNTVTGVVDQNGTTYTAKVVVDATEYGDLLPLAGARYRVGNSTSDSVNQNACIQDITYTAVIKKYPNGVPQELVMKNPPPGYNETLKQQFARIISKDGKPNFGAGYPYNWDAHNAYRGMPDSSNPQSYTATVQDSPQISKTGVNWMNDYPATYAYNAPDGFQNPFMPVSFLENSSYRKQAICNAKLKTLQILYYAQTELGQTQWAVANDEGYDTAYNKEENSCSNIPAEFKAIEKHLPIMPYVRESRRIIGLHTLTANDIKRRSGKASKVFTSVIALGDYEDDLHSCDKNNNLETSLETRESIGGAGPFQIPFEAFIPETVDGFVVAEKNISQTRLTNGATRLQPVTMMTGQAAGTIAALAAQQNAQPRTVSYQSVQAALKNAGVNLSY
jgi:hypothetical protein